MRQRDDALEAATAALTKQQDAKRSLELQIKGDLLKTKHEQAENEKLQAILTRTQSEVRVIDTQLASIEATKKQHADRVSSCPVLLPLLFAVLRSSPAFFSCFCQTRAQTHARLLPE